MNSKIFIIGAIFVIAFSSCYPTGEAPYQIDETIDSNIIAPELDERYVLDINYDVDYPSRLPILSCKPMNFENVDMELLFFGDSKGTYQKELHGKSNVLPDGDYYHLYSKGENDDLLCYDAGQILYITKKAFSCNYSFFVNMYGTQKYKSAMKVVFPDNEIKNYSLNDSLQKTRLLINELNLPVVNQPEVYVIDQNAVNNIDGIEEWNSENDAYMFIYPMQYSGISTLCTSIASSNDSYVGDISCLSVICTNNGIEYFGCRNAMEIEESNDSISICSPEIAANSVLKNYSLTVLPSNVTEAFTEGCYLAYDLKLSIQTEGQFKLEPVWIFNEKKTLITNGTTPLPFYSLLAIDAQTGERY